MRTLKKLTTAIVLAAAGFLAACSDGKDTVTIGQAREMQTIAAGAARVDEDAKTEAKYVKAAAEMDKLAADTVRNGKFMSQSNCAVKPEGFAATSAAKTFPGKAFDFYHGSCAKYVGHAVAAAKAERNRAVAAEQERQRKLAAAKAKREQLAKKAEAKRLAAAKKSPVKTVSTDKRS